MRISDWSSDVCSSDLGNGHCRKLHGGAQQKVERFQKAAKTLPVAAPQIQRPFQLSHRRLGKFVPRVIVTDAGCRGDKAGEKVFPHFVGLFDFSANRSDPLSGGSYLRSEEHTSEIQSLMRIPYDV